MPLDRTWQITAVAAATGLAAATVAIAAAGPWESGQRTAERARAAAHDHRTDTRRTAGPDAVPQAPAAPPAAALVLRPVQPAGTPAAALADAPGGTPLATRLDRLITAPGLGTPTTGAVIDLTTGQLVYAHRATTAGTPASITKLATAVAALGTLGPAHRFSTTVVMIGPGRIVLVGGGDPTLELPGLADDTAAALKAKGIRSIRLGYDVSYFAGPSLHPIGHDGNLAPVTALMVREGRLDSSSSGPARRAYDPALAAAKAFAAALRARGITVTGTPATASGAGGVQLAVHRSQPLSDLVERMLTNSDNDLAEALARQVARATGRRPDFAGGAAAIRAALAADGVPLNGAVFTDGSGLAHADALAPLTVARVLALAGDPRHPGLRPVLTGLPVAGFTGTLRSRFHGSPGAGVVHAKTGTLTGTNTIAGTVLAPSGHIRAFCFMTQGTASAAAAEGALDHLAAALTAP